MDIKEFTKSISGKEYGYPQFTKEEIEIAKESGVCIMYAENDSVVNIKGAIERKFQTKEYCETEDFKNEECKQKNIYCILLGTE